MLFELILVKVLNTSDMDSKTLATIMVVFLCVLLFPVFIGIVGGIFGVIGSVFGGFVGLIGSLFGAIFGIIGALFGAIFGVFGWIFGDHHHWHWPMDFFSGDLFAVLLVVLVVVLMSRPGMVRRPGK